MSLVGFASRAECLAKQYSQFDVFGKKVKYLVTYVTFYITPKEVGGGDILQAVQTTSGSTSKFNVLFL